MKILHIGDIVGSPGRQAFTRIVGRMRNHGYTVCEPVQENGLQADYHLGANVFHQSDYRGVTSTDGQTLSNRALCEHPRVGESQRTGLHARCDRVIIIPQPGAGRDYN